MHQFTIIGEQMLAALQYFLVLGGKVVSLRAWFMALQ